MFTGGAAPTGLVRAESAVVEPHELDAVTCARIRLPTSPEVSVYVLDVAPAMSEQSLVAVA